MTDPAALHIQERLRRAGRYNRWIADTIRPWLAPRHADVGAGAGNVVAHLVDRELTVLVEPLPEFVHILRERFANDPRVRVVQGDGGDPSLPERLTPLGLGSLSMINVLEHIPDDVSALRIARDSVVPGGRVCLFVPAHQWLFGEMDRADHHCRRYTRRTLRAAMRTAGLRVEAMRAFNPAGIPAWWYSSVLRRRALTPESDYGRFDRLVPVLSAVERRVPMPIGLSLIAVGRAGG